MRLRLKWLLCLIGPLLALLSASSAQNSRIKVETLRCDAGNRYHPTDVSVAVFNAAKIPEILMVYREYKTAIEKLNDDANARRVDNKPQIRFGGGGQPAGAIAHFASADGHRQKFWKP